MSIDSINLLDHAIYKNALQAVSDSGVTSTEAIIRAIDTNDNLSPEEKTEIKEWIMNKKELRIITTGKTGAGKSSLLNCFVGANLFKEGGDLDPCTMVVDQHECTKDGIHVIAWDCPGLQDGLDNEEEYLRDLAEKTERNVDLMLYCMDMSATRATELRMHGSAIQKLTEILGPGVWSNTVIALTFANLYEARLQATMPGIKEDEMVREFEKQINLWKTKLQQALRGVGVPDDVISALPVFPAGYHTTPHLPGYPLWASHMWMTMLFAIKEYAQPLPIMLSVGRFREKIELNEEHFRLPPEQQLIFISESKLPHRGLSINCNESAADNVTVFGSVVRTSVVGSSGIGPGVATGVAAAGVGAGVVAGTAAGSIVGAATFGVGAGVGMVIGAGVGLGVGVASGMIIDIYRRRIQRKKAEKLPQQ